MLNFNRLSIIGAGYVGLVTGACLSEFGLTVTCMDSDPEKVRALDNGIVPICETGLDQLMAKNRSTGRLRFTTDMDEAVRNSPVIFLALGTPSNSDGAADLSQLQEAAVSIARTMDDYKLVVIKSTVPVGTSARVKASIAGILKERGLDCGFDVAANPEFLREGSAIRDFMHPDRVVIGHESENARNILKNIYNVLYLIDVPFVFTSLEAAELIKHASNAFLATKISFINEMSDLCRAVGADVHSVAEAMGLDGRIGKYFLHPGPGYGGSCLPKDARALVRMAEDLGLDMKIIRATVQVNESRPALLLERMKDQLVELDGKCIAVLGLSFKQNTDDIRESPGLRMAEALADGGAMVRLFDPLAMDKARKHLSARAGKTWFASDEYDAAGGADALVVMTEWNQFRHLDMQRLRAVMKGNTIFDFRNLYDPAEVREQGFIYVGVGRG